ncbi:MAG: hypothetical protein ACYC5O_10600 [Anaerolineae bacterium]
MSQSASQEPPHAASGCAEGESGKPVLARKRVTTREDGRYVIYYEFEAAKPAPEAGQ